MRRGEPRGLTWEIPGSLFRERKVRPSSWHSWPVWGRALALDCVTQALQSWRWALRLRLIYRSVGGWGGPACRRLGCCFTRSEGLMTVSPAWLLLCEVPGWGEAWAHAGWGEPTGTRGCQCESSGLCSVSLPWPPLLVSGCLSLHAQRGSPVQTQVHTDTPMHTNSRATGELRVSQPVS